MYLQMTCDQDLYIKSRMSWAKEKNIETHK